MTYLPRWLIIAVLLLVAFVVTRHPAYPTTVRVTLVQATPPTALSRLTPQVIAKELLTPESYVCWSKIVASESHFNPKAKSKTSDATGIGQLLKVTYQTLGMRQSKDSTAQMVAMFAYVNRRFGGHNRMCSAWKYHQQVGTY